MNLWAMDSGFGILCLKLKCFDWLELWGAAEKEETQHSHKAALGRF